ncbi:DUF2637 domain-containing protein [Streptomyces nanshensis]|uniref:DUF2637 domain-containing protein n=1 Tax=Streptomyces nanshensis TaxID=518642 RepID=A0A1E7L214_9ACTN|nr:DUF2637 domain-containing protein [Streptomyces nanshensis]OEV10226.1 hypothetical protein AN218_18580 [Streptomyces nanshensis]
MHWKDPGAWTKDNWYLVLGTLVLIIGSLLIVRALRRANKRRALLAARAAYDEHADRVGKRAEDILTLAVASAAAYLSSTGLRKFGRDMMQLQSPADWLPFFALDIAAFVCGKRARRRARRGDGPGLSGALMWALIGVSAVFSGSEGDTVWQQLSRVPWPLIAGILFELGSLEERRTKREDQKRSAGEWIERKLDAVRMLHPVEWVRVRMALAADESISTAQATRLVRIERAGYRMYRLRMIKKTYDDHGKWTAWLFAGRLERANRRAQVTQARVKRDDIEYVIEAFQRRVRTITIANGEYTTPQQAQKAARSMLLTEPRTGQTDRTGPPNRTEASEVRTGTAEPVQRTGTTEPNRTSEPAPRTGAESEPNRSGEPAEPVHRTGRTEPANRPGSETRTGRTEPAEPNRTEQVNTGTATGSDAESSDDEGPSDEELIAALRRALLPNGKFSIGGQGKVASHFRIGTGRAKRVMKEARSLPPIGSDGMPSGTPPNGQEENEKNSAPAAAGVIDLEKAFDVTNLLGRGEPTEHEMALAGPAANRAAD